MNSSSNMKWIWPLPLSFKDDPHISLGTLFLLKYTLTLYIFCYQLDETKVFTPSTMKIPESEAVIPEPPSSLGQRYEAILLYEFVCKLSIMSEASQLFRREKFNWWIWGWTVLWISILRPGKWHTSGMWISRISLGGQWRTLIISITRDCMQSWPY